MVIKGSYFWYGLLLWILVWILYGWIQSLPEDTRKCVLGVGTLILFFYSLLTVDINEEDLKFGSTFYNDQDDEIWYIFRFSPVHFIVFMITVTIALINKPIVIVSNWCDKYLTIGKD